MMGQLLFGWIQRIRSKHKFSYTNFRHELHELSYNPNKLYMPEIILKQESYQLIGICMEVHRELGMGLKEIVYKDALEYEFKLRHIPYTREKEYKNTYKGIVLTHRYNADFIVYGSIILEAKATSMIVNGFVK